MNLKSQEKLRKLILGHIFGKKHSEYYYELYCGEFFISSCFLTVLKGRYEKKDKIVKVKMSKKVDNDPTRDVHIMLSKKDFKKYTFAHREEITKENYHRLSLVDDVLTHHVNQKCCDIIIDVIEKVYSDIDKN